MISTLAQDEHGDLAVTAKGPYVVRGAEAVVVLVMNNLRERPTENFLIPARGHAWSSLIGKGATSAAIRSDVVPSVGAVSGVEQVKSCSVNIVRERINIDLVLGTDQPRTEFSVALTL